MELSLSRVDLLQVGSTGRNNLRLLPLSKRSTQKVVVGDADGHVRRKATARARPLSLTHARTHTVSEARGSLQGSKGA
jgi:hypothetical protein